MEKRVGSRRRKAAIAAVILLCATAIGVPLYQHYERQSAIEATLAWARLAPFPSTMHNFRIRTEGNMFTRTFVVTFGAPPADIDAWLQRSPGPAAVQPTTDGTVRTYTYTPGGGANRAHVSVDDATHTVEVYAEWS